jgi:NAD(P)-dependent dehydrogenase (short-subunit alcohol dehydrogenase family)
MKEGILKNKVAVISGASSGIGKAIAIKFAVQEAVVYVLDLDSDGGRQTIQEIEKAGGQAFFYKCDVSIQQEVVTIFKEIWSDYKVDILVNNAGIAHIGNLENTREADMDRLYKVNVKGIYNCMYACIPFMKENNSGVILNMASIAASKAVADRFAYSMSKGAVRAMTYSVAKDYLAFGIRCNCISPARIHTPFVDNFLAQNYPGQEKEMFEKLSKSQPIARMGKPEEVAALALFLCSEDAAFITGMDYPIDGGYINLL